MLRRLMFWEVNVSFPNETACETSSSVRTFPCGSISAIAIRTLVEPISTTATGRLVAEITGGLARVWGPDDMIGGAVPLDKRFPDPIDDNRERAPSPGFERIRS